MSLVAGNPVLRPMVKVYLPVEKDDGVELIIKMKASAFRIEALRGQLDEATGHRVDEVLIQLDKEERLYFHYFNRIRVVHGHKPLAGEKFTSPVLSESAQAMDKKLSFVTRSNDDQPRYESIFYR
jgi:hypothetical protein